MGWDLEELNRAVVLAASDQWWGPNMLEMLEGRRSSKVLPTTITCLHGCSVIRFLTQMVRFVKLERRTAGKEAVF